MDISDEARSRLARAADELLKLEQEPSPVYSRRDFGVDSSSTEGESQATGRDKLMQEIKDRIDSGYYDRSDITNLVAEKLSDEFDS